MDFIFTLSHALLLVQGLASVRFTAITDSPNALTRKLYLEEWNEDPPLESDPVITDGSARLQICEDIINSKGAFADFEAESYDATEIYYERRRRSNDGENRRPHLSNYINGYRRREFLIAIFHPLSFAWKAEYVFLCALKRKYADEIVPFYVSKVYSKGFRVHRYVLLEEEGDQLVWLAESSANNYIAKDFNVELHYLELRKHHSPTTCHSDPLCRLTTMAGNMGRIQMYRLCMIVLTSPHFAERIRRPCLVPSTPALPINIAFKTAVGREMAAGKSYHELMICCYVSLLYEDDFGKFCISRAYNPNQVFVYIPDPSDHNKFYIENLNTNVHIVQEQYNFGDVET